MTCARLETKRLPSTSNAQLANAADLAEECNGIEDDAVADDALAARPQHAAGNELQHELVLADDDRVPGVMAAGVARHGGKPLAEHVYDLSLALVAPLGAQHHSRLCSHRRPDSTRLRRFSNYCGVLRGVQGGIDFHPTNEDLSVGNPVEENAT